MMEETIKDSYIYKVFDFIVRFIDNNGYPPSQREIAKGCYLSRTAVVNHLNKMQTMEWIKRDPSKARALVILRDKDLSYESYTR